MRRPLPTLLAVTFLVACGNQQKADAVAKDPRNLVLDDKGLSLGGARLDGVPEDKMWKVEALFTKLKEQRETWKQEHPDGKFDGTLSITLGPTITCNAAMSVYMTAALAGYPHITLTQGGTTLAIKAKVPGPSPEEFLAKQAAPPLYTDVVFQANGEAELKPGRCSGAFDVVQASALAPAVKEMCGEAAECLQAMKIRCEPGVLMSQVLAPVKEIHALASGKMELGTLGQCGPNDGPTTREYDLSNPLDPPAKPRPAAFGPTKKPPRGQTREGAVTVTGGLTEEEVRDTLKAKKDAILTCYEQGLVNNPNLQGRITAKIAVGKKGGVMSVTNGGSDLPDSGVLQCVLVAVSQAIFPPKGKVSVMTYPVMMSPK